ncbi:hypothetical protein PoB_006480900 [Plakobranchus ocellatus]|uniref:Uncharacterized protein n=1 Tax=Plakobranchus ocellatus TaxID=259542 RepID=A0AAV4D279_9GAST|nr:hypothetical protein PoB_006480900 [Plakobranchus ocellatus]
MFSWVDRRDGRPTETTLLYTLASVLVPIVFSSMVRQQPSGPKIDTHVYLVVIMGGTTPYPKHNAERRHRQNVWTTAVLRCLDTVGA